MPVDTSIYAPQPQQASPVDAFQRAMAASQQRQAQQQESQLRAAEIQKQQFALKEAQDKAAEDDQFKAAMQSSAGLTPEQLVEHIRQHAPGHVMAVQAALDASNEKAALAKKASADAASANSEAATRQQTYIGHLADQIDQSGYNPVVVNAALNQAVKDFPDWKDQADAIRQIGATQGKDALMAALKPLIPSDVSKTRAETANAQVELPGKSAEAQRQQRILAGTNAVGMTADQQAANANAARNTAISAARLVEEQRHNQSTEAASDVTNPKRQEALEQQYRGVLARTLSSRSGGLGMEDQKVNQAIHLMALLDQGKDPKTGQYNIPKAQFAELANGLATLVSPNSRPTDSMRGEIEAKTAKGDFNGVLAYLTGTPFNGSTQDMYKVLRDSIERQGSVAEANREGYFDAIKAQAPTDLEDARRQKLEQSLKLNRMGTTRQQQPIPGIPGGVAELRDGKWIRVK